MIIEYIDDVRKGVSIMPQDAYEKAQARFWARFIDDKEMVFIFFTCYLGLSLEIVSSIFMGKS